MEKSKNKKYSIDDIRKQKIKKYGINAIRKSKNKEKMKKAL